MNLDVLCADGRCRESDNELGWETNPDGTVRFYGDLKALLSDPEYKRSVMGGDQGKVGLFAFFDYESGSSWDKLAEAYAGTHDTLNSFIFYDEHGNIKKGVTGTTEGKIGEFLNYTNVAVATPFALSEILPPEIWHAILVTVP